MIWSENVMQKYWITFSYWTPKPYGSTIIVVFLNCFIFCSLSITQPDWSELKLKITEWKAY